jgi:hypothetical protein
MFSNLAIDVVLGLIFIYLLYSLLASVIQELLARIFHSRARLLTKGLRRMLEEDDHRADLGWFGKFTFFNWFYELGWSLVYFFEPFRGSPFLRKFYESPAIRRLGENSVAARPAYISPRIFSQTMVHLLRQSCPSPGSTDAASIETALTGNLLQLAPETRDHLWQLFKDAGEDVGIFRINMEEWFNETMNRASGWYRRQTQTWLLLLGLGIAALFNVDSIAIAHILMKDKDARSQLVQLASSRAPAYTAITDTLIQKNVLHRDSSFFRADSSLRVFVSDTSLIGIYAMLREDAGEASNVLGISRACRIDSNGRQLPVVRCGLTHPYQQNSWLVFGGWGITALAISLGAPFWFDLLGKVVKFRTAVPPGDNSGSR